MRLVLVLGLAIVHQVLADVYLHIPRGSNNRLNENTQNRRQANRVFDSQNNNKGGYNVGDLTDKRSGNNKDKQYPMEYFMSHLTQGSTDLQIEWTAQHGCGGNEDNSPNKLNCNIVMQYMCQPETGLGSTTEKEEVLRNGVQTGRQNYNDPQNNERGTQYENRLNNVDRNKVLQEPMQWYDKCHERERNKGLFTADQNLNGNNRQSARSTRQNPNGNRNGYECPEERDYYPYWHPSPWKDIAILAENQTMCDYYQKESHNVVARHECYEGTFRDSNIPKHYSEHNNEADCTNNGGIWIEFHNYLEIDDSVTNEEACLAKSTEAQPYIWGQPMILDGRNWGIGKKCLVALKKPDCKEAPFSRVNHLGNGEGLEPVTYTWKIPYFPSGVTQKCAFRLRYNITTDDYDPYNTDSEQNGAANSPVTQNPDVEVAQGETLDLAINTAQFGRTFQDRSHIFKIKPRPSDVPAAANIINLNVRGKRGNIVQTYPAVEYDFAPTNIEIEGDNLIHAQWTGSNSHNNQGGGDGQAGDDGQGRGGTDRSNMVAMGDRLANFPSGFENTTTLFQNMDIIWAADITDPKTLTAEDRSVIFASSGYYNCVYGTRCQGESLQNKNQMNQLLNNAPATFKGALFKVTEAGTYNYMCSRNNNFSNRSQKGTIVKK